MRESARRTAGEQPTVFSLKSRRSFFGSPFFRRVIGRETQHGFANRNYCGASRVSPAHLDGARMRLQPFGASHGRYHRRQAFQAGAGNFLRAGAFHEVRHAQPAAQRAPSRKWAGRDWCRWRSRRSAARSTVRETRCPASDNFSTRRSIRIRNAQVLRRHAIRKSDRGIERRRHQNRAGRLQGFPRRIRFRQIVQLLVHFSRNCFGQPATKA